VEIQSDNKVIDAMEIYAGSGYLSQSPQVIYFSLPKDKAANSSCRVTYPSGKKILYTLPIIGGTVVIDEAAVRSATQE
jgi:hypothetical protein